MNRRFEDTAHLADGELVLRIDAELDDIRALRVERHITQCAMCRERYATLDAADRDWKSLVDAVPAPPTPSFQPRRPRRPRPRARAYARRLGFAAALAAIAATAGVPAIRTAAAEAARQLLEALGGTASPESGPAPATTRAGDEIAFAATSSSVVIEFAAAQPAGSLTLRPGTGPRVSLAVFDAPGPAVALLPDTIRILNTDTVAASYRLSIPASVSRITVLLAGERRLRLDRSSLGAAGHKITLRP